MPGLFFSRRRYRFPQRGSTGAGTTGSAVRCPCEINWQYQRLCLLVDTNSEQKTAHGRRLARTPCTVAAPTRAEAATAGEPAKSATLTNGVSTQEHTFPNAAFKATAIERAHLAAMTPTGCSPSTAGSSIWNSGQNCDAEDRLLAEGLSTPVLAGLSCSMDVSKLLVALTAPLLNSNASTDGSCTSASATGDGSDTGNRCGGPSNGHGGQADEIDDIAAEGSTEGDRKHQQKQQHQTATHPRCWPMRCAAEQEAITVRADESMGAPPTRSEDGTGKRNRVVCDFGATSQEQGSVSTADVTVTDKRALHCGTACERNVEDETRVTTDTAVPTTVLLPQLQQGGKVLSQQDAIHVQQITRKIRESGPEEQDETECRTAQEMQKEAAPRDAIIGNTLHTAHCSGAQRSPSPESVRRKAAGAEEGEIAAGDTEAAEGKSAGSVCDGGVPGGNPRTQNLQKLPYHDKVRAQQVEPEQQKASPSVSPTTIATDQSRHPQQQRERPCHRQELVPENESQDAQQELTKKKCQQETQQEQHQRQRQGADRGESWVQKLRPADEGKKKSCDVVATCVAQREGGRGDAKGDAGERSEIKGAADNQGIARAAPSAVQQEGQLLVEKLGQLQKAACQSEDSTGSPSKRTSFEDGAEGSAGTERHQNSARVHQGLQQHRTMKELKQQLLQQFSPKEEVVGHIEDELKKSVTAVLAAALGGRDANGEGGACATSYPLSLASQEATTECFTTSSFETAASSQSESPLNLQKDEAPEGARRDSTNVSGFSSTCSAPKSKSEHSDSPGRIQHSSGPDKASISRANSSSSTSSTASLADRESAVHTSATSESDVAAPCSHSASGNRSASGHSDTPCLSSAPSNSNALGGTTSTSDASGVSGSSSGSGSSSALDSGSAYGTSSVSRSSRTPGAPNCAVDINNGLSGSSAPSSSEAIESGAAARPGTLSKSSSVSSKSCRSSQDTKSSSSSSAADWTPAVVGAAVLEDCIHSVIDLEQHAARVLRLSSTEGGGAKQVFLPSLLLQKTTLGSGGQLSDWGMWGGKKEKETRGRAGTCEDVVISAASSFAFYPSALGEAAAVGVRKDPAGALLLPPVSDGNIEVTAADAQACRLLQQQVAPNSLSTGGAAILGTGTVTHGSLGTPGTADTETAAGILEQSLSQIWMMQQRSGCLGAPISPTAACSFQLPSPVPASFRWAPPATTSNIGTAASVGRTPASTAIAAAALLPRSFRSRSDYLSLCSLQGCAATQENDRKPRNLEELRQLPSEEHISLQEMHLLAESLVHDFMKLHHSTQDLSTSNRTLTRGGQRGNAQKGTQQDKECTAALTGAAAGTVAQRAEPLVLHYRRDNLSFSVTPASAFTPYPPSVFEGTRKKAHLRNGGASRVGVPLRNSMDEMEEEKKETLLGARFFTSSDFRLDSGYCPLSSEKSITRREAASRGQSKNSAADGARTQAATASDADEFIPPQATTHFFRARCQQAGTEIGISDSTIGAVERAFAEATTSFFREIQRQNERFVVCNDRTKQIVADEQERKQQRNCGGGRGTAEESQVNGGKADMRAPSIRTVGTVARGYQRLVPGGSGGAVWRHERVN